MILPLPLIPIQRLWNHKTNNKIDNNMPEQHTSTVTISLKEYNEMKQSLDTLHNALEDNKVIIRDPYSRGAYMAYHTFTRDEVLNKIAGRYYEMEERYKATQANNDYLADKLYWMEKTWWFKLGKLFDKRNLVRK